MIGDSEMDFICRDQPNVAINTAVKIKIGRQRRYVFVKTVVNTHRERVRTRFYKFGYIDRKRRISADMPPRILTIHKNVCDLICSLKI